MSAPEAPSPGKKEPVDTGGGARDGGPSSSSPVPAVATVSAIAAATDATTSPTSGPVTLTPVTLKKEPETPASPISPVSPVSPITPTRPPVIPVASNGKVGDANPAEICVVIGGNDRGPQTQGSYVCGVCGKKYKYYNCFQTHVRAHRESEIMVGDGPPPTPNNNFRYSCDICGKKYKYYSCFQEHRDLHAVDDPYEHQQVILPVDDLKEEMPVEPYKKIGPKSGSYLCAICGKQYKYFNPYQEHVALHIGLPTADLGSPFELKSSPVQKRVNMDIISKYVPSQTGKANSLFSAMPPSLVDTNSSQNSSGTQSPLVASSFSTSQKPFTCGACGIQFQFYNNLLEHMQSHAADNENHTKGDSPKISPASGHQEALWRGSQALALPTLTLQVQSHAAHPPPQRNHSLNQNNGLPEKERQQVAERLLRLMCSDVSMLSVLNSKDFLKLAQTLVDTGARHGAYSTRDALGSNMSALALRQLPRMYNQVKVKVTCALGSNASLGIAVTCHSQTSGPDACYVLTAYQVEGSRLKRYILGVREAELREGPDQVHQWVQNVLSEFVMSDIRTVYVSEPRLWAAGLAGSPLGGGGGGGAGGRGRLCLRCAGCSLGAIVQAVLGKRSLQARGLHELAELLSTCRDIAASTSLSLEPSSSNHASANNHATEEGPAQSGPATPPCWDRTAEALLQVHAHFEHVCEAYGRSKATAPLLQGLNKHLLGTLAFLLSPLRLAALELSRQRRPTLQQVVPVYLRLEKLFTAKAGEAGTGTASKLCHYFLEALKENFKVERAHQVAMVLDPQLKLRPVPAYQHEDIISRACEMATETQDGGISAGGGSGGGGGGDERDADGPPALKRGRMDGGVGTNGGNTLGTCSMSGGDDNQSQVRQEMFQYLAEPLLQGTPDLFQYWSSGPVGERFPRLARLALWLLAVPAVGIRSECVAMCEQSLAMKRRQQVTAEEMNKLIFLRSNMG